MRARRASRLAWKATWLRDVIMIVAGIALALPAGCTYAPPAPLVRVTHHARRGASDSVAIAVYAARVRMPTGLAAFPDGGSPRLEDERAVFYLCVAPPDDSAVVLRRVATVTPGPELRYGFEPWVSLWDGPDSFVASLLGYDRAGTSDSAARHVRWLRISLDGAVAPLASGRPTVLPPASSLPRSCEAASVADARRMSLADASSR